MNAVSRPATIAFAGALSLLGATVARSQQEPVSDKPLQEMWAPTEFGPGDKAGVVNRTTPALVRKAVSLVGLGDLGVEHVAEKGFVCRGVLLDAPAYRGMKRLPVPNDTRSPGIVTAADVQAMVKRQGLAEIGEGDCVFLYTGHGDLWSNAEWKSLSPEEKAKRRVAFTAGMGSANSSSSGPRSRSSAGPGLREIRSPCGSSAPHSRPAT